MIHAAAAIGLGKERKIDASATAATAPPAAATAIFAPSNPTVNVMLFG